MSMSLAGRKVTAASSVLPGPTINPFVIFLINLCKMVYYIKY